MRNRLQFQHSLIKQQNNTPSSAFSGHFEDFSLEDPALAGLGNSQASPPDTVVNNGKSHSLIRDQGEVVASRGSCLIWLRC